MATMDNKTNKSETATRRRAKKTLAAMLLIYCSLCLWLLPFYRYQINPDGISYINSAYKYLAGDIFQAVTGHWSPLLSWLVLPLLACDIAPLLAIKIVSAASGSLSILAIWLLSYRFNLPKNIKNALLVASLPIALAYAYCQITPDLLNTGIFLLYFYVVSDRNFFSNPRNGISAGLLGGGAYLAKHYSFPLFIVHFFAVTLLHCIKTPDPYLRKKTLSCFLTGMSVFLLTSSPYIVTISAKYGGLMFSTTGYANYVSMSPKESHVALIPFYPPPDKMSSSVWDDPHTFFISNTWHIPWSPFESPAAFKHLVKIVWGNIVEVVGICVLFSPLAFFLGVGLILIYCRHPGNLIRDNAISQISVMMLICSAGYCIARLGVEDRYILLNSFVLLVLGGYALKKIFEHCTLSPRLRYILLFLCIVSSSIWPAVNLYKSFNAGRDIYMLGKELQSVIPPGSALAASGNWYESLFLTFHLKSQIYGTIENMASEEAAREFDKHGIEYLLAWNNDPDRQPFLAQYQRIAQGVFGKTPFSIYRLR